MTLNLFVGRFCYKVLYRRRNMGPGGEQHPDIFHERPDTVPDVHQVPKTQPRDESEGLGHVLGLHNTEAGIYPPDDVPLFRQRHPRRSQTPKRIRLPHLLPDREGQEADLVQVYLQDKPRFVAIIFEAVFYHK